ncbi:MAG: response regulator [Deltaproteobacteria bacterium]|jgi:signal transduction histidine kinase/DNA-binding response OmpR family regulator|nr:response regulator [Deltaproteobacteria bacterium]
MADQVRGEPFPWIDDAAGTQGRHEGLSLKFRFTLFFILFVTAIFSVVAVTSVQQIHEAATTIANRLGGPIARRAAAFTDGDAFGRLAASLDPEDTYYDLLRMRLRGLKEETQCLYLYTMAQDGNGVHRFIVDGGNPGDQGFSPLGSVEDVSDYTQAYLRTYETGTMQFGEMDLQESWGWVISTYVPILDSSGAIVGVIGCDFEANSIYEQIYAKIVRQTAFAVFFAALGFWLYRHMFRSISKQNWRLLEMGRKAEEASRSKSAFLARMSHEIRTPMNAIIGLSELAQRDHGAPETLEYIAGIKSAGLSLLSIINDILDFSRIESGKLALDAAPYATGSLLNDTLSIISVRLAEKPVEFILGLDLTLPSVLVGDATRVRQVLLNILSNAVKYTDKGHIRFSASWEERPDGQASVSFQVEDSGVGIRASDLPGLFGDFVRLNDDRSRHVEGTGLGLSITRSLCRAMGGDVSAESEHGRGSVFTATIVQGIGDRRPMGDIGRRTLARVEPSRVPFLAPGADILLVDDLPSNLMVAEGLLAPFGARLFSCPGGREAVELASSRSFDLVFMDHMMPGLDGLAATAAIRALPGRGDVPIIALTANAVSGMREMFLRSGFNDFLSKPIEVKRLFEIMERWIPAEKRVPAPDLGTSETPGEPVAKADPLEVEGLDAAAGQVRTGESLPHYLDLLETFCRDARVRLPLLAETTDGGGARRFIPQVHALKGILSSIGADGLAKAAAVLEESGRCGQTGGSGVRLAVFRDELGSLVCRAEAALRRVRAQEACPLVEGATGPVEVPGLEETVLWARLEEALGREDLDSIDTALGGLRGLPLAPGRREILLAVAGDILAAEFQKAREAIVSLGPNETGA